MKSELEQVREALAEFDRLEQTMSCPDILYAEVGSWLDKRKRIEQPKTIASKMGSVNAEKIILPRHNPVIFQITEYLFPKVVDFLRREYGREV